MSEILALPTINVTIFNARGARGFASGPLGAGSVDAETIADDVGDQAAILDKIGGIGAKTEVDIAPQAGFFPPMPNGFRAYGDSQTYQIVDGVTGYRDILATRLDVTAENRAISGGSFMDWGQVTLLDDCTAGDVSTILPGYNDLRANGANAAKAESYYLGLAANVLARAIPNSRKQYGSELLASATGDWAPIPLTDSVYEDIGIFSDGAGDAVSFTAYGSAVYVVGLSISTTGGSFTLTVDGVAHHFTQSRAVGNGGAVSPDGFGPALYALRNLGDGKHACTLTVNGDGNVYFLWGGGSSSFGEERPKVLVGNTLRVKASSQASFAPYDQYTEAGQLLYSRLAERAVRELAGDGLNVAYVDAAGAYDPETQTSGDGIHMSQTGQTNVANAFFAELDMRRSLAAVSAAVLGERARSGTVRFTPTLYGFTTPGTQTYTARAGEYTLDGEICTYRFRIVLATKGGSMAGFVAIGLPLAAAAPGDLLDLLDVGTIGRAKGITLISGARGLYGEVIPGTSAMLIGQGDDSSTWLGAADITGTAEISGQIRYRVALA